MKNFLFYFLTYILTITAVAYVTVKVDSFTSTDGSNKPQSVVVVPETVGNKILTNIITMGGAEVKVDINIDENEKNDVQLVNSISKQQTYIKLNFVGAINIQDLQNIKLDGDLTVEYSNEKIVLKLIMFNNKLYVNNGNLNVKVEVESLVDVAKVLSYFGVNLNFDMSNIDIDSITSMLNDIKEEKLEDGSIKLKLLLFDEYEIILFCDGEYNLKSVMADIQINNIVLNVNASLEKSSTISIVNPENVECSDSVNYFDLTGASNLIDKIANTLKNTEDKSILSFSMNNLVLSFGDFNMYIDGIIAIDTKSISFDRDLDVNKFNIDINASLKMDNYSNVIDFEIIINEGMVYFTCEDVSLSISLNNVFSLIDILSEMVSNDPWNKVSLVLQNFDFFKNIMLVKLNKSFSIEKLINSVKFLEFNENEGKIVIDGTLIKGADDVEIKAIYINDLVEFEIEKLKIKNFSISGGLVLEGDYKVKEIDANKYSSIDKIVDFANGILDLEEEYYRYKQFAVNFSTSMSTEHPNYINGKINERVQTTYVVQDGNFQMDWSDQRSPQIYLKASIVQNITSIPYKNGIENTGAKETQTTDHKVELLYLDKYLYLTFDEYKFKLKDLNLKSIFTTLSEFLNNFDSEMGAIGTIISNGNIIEQFKPSIIKELNVSETEVTGFFDLSKFKLNADKDAYISARLESKNLIVELENIAFGNYNFGRTEIVTSEETNIPDVVEEEYTNLIGIGNLVDASLNSALTQHFGVSGNVNLKVSILDFININWNLPIELNVNITNETTEMEFTVSNIPVIVGVNDDAPYVFGNTVSGISCAKDRTLKFYFKDNMIIINRFERIPVFVSEDRTYEKVQMIHIDTFLDNPLYYIFEYGIGFKPSIMEKIYGTSESGQSSGQVNNISSVKNIISSNESSNGVVTLKVNLNNILGNTFGELEVNIEFDSISNKKVIKHISLATSINPTKNVEIDFISNDLNSKIEDKKISEVFDHYTHKEGQVWYAINNEWKRDDILKYKLFFVTNCEKVLDFEEFDLGSIYSPTILPDYYTYTDAQRITHKFAGWYTSYDFSGKSIDGLIIRKNTTIFAKWQDIAENYVLINFESNTAQKVDSIKALAEQNLTLPKFDNLVTEETNEGRITKQFIGWFKDEDLTESYVSDHAPKNDITLYAKWKILDIEKAYKLNIYDNGVQIDSMYVVGGDQIELIGVKYREDTKYYIDKDCLILFAFGTMPNNDLNLYIKNYYQFTYTSEYGDVTSKSLNILQGQKIAITQQKSYYIDDGTYTQRVEYTFNGYLVNGELYTSLTNFYMENNDVNVVASWSVNVKKYYTVSFDINFVKPSAWIQNSFAVKTTCKKAPRSLASIKVLEGSTIEINPYIYSTTCEYEYRAIGISKTYKFKVKNWNLVQGEQLSYNDTALAPSTENYSEYLTLTVNEDIVLYPVWYCVE